MVHSLILRIYITWALILGSAEVLIIDQYSSGLFNCDTAMSKIFECRPVKNRTMRYAAVCVLSGNVAFGKNLIPYVDTCQSAVKSFATRALIFSLHIKPKFLHSNSTRKQWTRRATSWNINYPILIVPIIIIIIIIIVLSK